MTAIPPVPVRPTPARRRLVTILLAATALLLVGAPAWADGAGPTNYSSELVAVEPPVQDVTIEVVGGDAFLQVDVAPGRRVMVLGYGRGAEDEEPYLRIDEDGTVLANVNSPAYYLNDDRYAQTEVPLTASVDAEPNWVEVGSGGRYSWHDHRIHWMSPGVPRAVERQPGDRVLVQEWTVPLEVDGQPVAVTGELYWLASTSPIVPIAVAVVAAGLVALAWRRRDGDAGPVAVLVAGASALVVTAGAATAPGTAVVTIVLGLLPVVIALALGLRASRQEARDRDQTVLVAALAVLAWAVPRLADTVSPVVPGALPTAVTTLGIALAGGVALAVAVLAGLRLRQAPAGAPDVVVP